MDRTDLDRLFDLNDNAVQMVPTVNLGEFEQVILLAILRLRDDAYGVTIRAERSARWLPGTDPVISAARVFSRSEYVNTCR